MFKNKRSNEVVQNFVNNDNYSAHTSFNPRAMVNRLEKGLKSCFKMISKKLFINVQFFLKTDFESLPDVNGCTANIDHTRIIKYWL